MGSGLKNYWVTFKSKSMPNFGTRRICITAPTKKYIRANWIYICGNPDLSIVEINAVA